MTSSVRLEGGQQPRAVEGVVTWKSGLGLGYGSHAEREFSWYLKGPLKTCDMALRLKVHTADAAMLFLLDKSQQ